MKGKIGVFITLITVAFLITGQLVGAGILGIPVIAGIAGFFPALIIMAVYGGAMFFSALILGKEAADRADPVFNFPSLYQEYLGRTGKWIAIVINMLMLYGLLVAYIAGGTAIITRIFNVNFNVAIVMPIFFALMTWFTLMGVNFVRKYTTILIILLWISFIALIIMGEKRINPAYLKHIDWMFFPVTVPIIVTSFNFSNLIPVVSKTLNWKMSLIWKAMFIGLVIAFVMNAAWIMVGTGILPLHGGKESLIYSFIHNLPATIPIAKAVHTPSFLTAALIFSVIAIVTSYVGNAIGLLSFNTDLVTNFLKQKSKILVALITFIPPLIITFIWPDIFIKAINITGGVCTIVLFGLFPSIIAFKKYKRGIRILACIAFIFFSFALLYQLGSQFNMIKISPPPAKATSKVTHSTIEFPFFTKHNTSNHA